MPKIRTGKTVFEAALDRLTDWYLEGYKLVYSVSGGKDSTVCMELGLQAAERTGNLPIQAIMRDEEIMFPGVFEYLERVAARPEVDFHWVYACQPIINVYNRHEPYWWVFDPLLEPDQWVRKPPDFAYFIPDKAIDYLISIERFPIEEGQRLGNVMGLRVAESINRKRGLFSSGGFVAGPNKWKTYNIRPIYDWTDDDVWKAIYDNGWDYAKTYDTFFRMGLNKKLLRIAPPTMLDSGIPLLQIGAEAWPRWFERVCHRLPGLRSVVRFGKAAVHPIRRPSESWSECFQRTCIDEAPGWIAERARIMAAEMVKRHARHSTTPFPEVTKCEKCGMVSSWESLAQVMYLGDPFKSKLGAGYPQIPYIEPEYFRPGAGVWGGKPAFS